MKVFGVRVAGGFAASLLAVAALGLPGRMIAQGAATQGNTAQGTAPATAPGMASIHGHVTDRAGITVTSGEVKLTTDRSANANRKFEYTFPLDAGGNYQGTGVKPGNYVAVVYQSEVSVDFLPAQIAAGEDKTLDFDMTRKEYIDKLSPAEKEQLEEFKKQHAATVAANAKIENLNAMLTSSRANIKAGNFDPAVKAMTDATAAKPDEPILWEVLGDAQLGVADAAAKAAKTAKTTDPSLPDKYGVAIASYQKALSLNAASSKSSAETAAIANNQLGQALGRLSVATGQPEKAKDAAAAYEAAAKADPSKAGMYYFNEAATLFNASAMDDAAAAADRAIAADPAKADAYYIKGQALIQKATVDASGKVTAPPDCVAAYQKYLELAPTGAHAEEVKGILQGIGEQVKSTYKAPGKK